MTTTYDGDKFTGLRPWSDDEPCCWCDDGSPPAGPMPNTVGCLPACASCIMAFEEGDAPEELAITLGNKDRGRVCLNQTCPRYGQLTSWNFCQFCEHATVPV